MSKSNRFRKRISGRSGFDYLEKETIKEKGVWIGSDERDDPPPSRISLGGEGDVSRGSYFRESTSSAVENENPTFYITAVGGITPTFSHPYMRVVGSNGAVTITANPKIASGAEGNVLTLFCTGSNISINHGNGVNLVGSKNLLMQSGSVAVFMYNTANNAWNETSRVSNDFGIGG